MGHTGYMTYMAKLGELYNICVMHSEFSAKHLDNPAFIWPALANPYRHWHWLALSTATAPLCWLTISGKTATSTINSEGARRQCNNEGGNNTETESTMHSDKYLKSI